MRPTTSKAGFVHNGPPVPLRPSLAGLRRQMETDAGARLARALDEAEQATSEALAQMRLDNRPLREVSKLLEEAAREGCDVSRIKRLAKERVNELHQEPPAAACYAAHQYRLYDERRF